MLSIFCHIMGFIFIALAIICSMLTWAYHKDNDKFCFRLMLFLAIGTAGVGIMYFITASLV